MVSASGKHFGIDVKGQSTKSFWQFGYKKPNPELFIAFVYVPKEGSARCFIVPSKRAMNLWKQYKESALARNVSHSRWGINWKTVHPYENKWDALPA